MVRLPYLLIIMATLCWGSTGIVAEKLFAAGLNPAEVIWFRVLICFTAALLYCLIAHRQLLKIQWQDLPFFSVYAFICVALFYFAYFNTIERAGTAVATILMYTAPAMVAVLSHYIFKEQINRAKILCIVLTLTGCFLVVKGYDLDNIKLNISGMFWAILAGLCYAMFSILGKKSAGRFHPLTLMVYGQGIGLLYLTFVASPLRVFTVSSGSPVWFYLLYVGLVTTFFPNLFYTTALKHIEPGRASIMAALEPVMAVFFVYLFFGQVLEPVQILGAGFVILAVIIVQIPTKAFRYFNSSG